jgi:hypothetical protein
MSSKSGKLFIEKRSVFSFLFCSITLVKKYKNDCVENLEKLGKFIMRKKKSGHPENVESDQQITS